MPPTIEQQLDLPVYEKVGNDTIEFPRLDFEDILKWTAEAKAARLRDGRTRLKANRELTPVERDRREQELIDENLNMGWLLNQAYEAGGIRKVLVMSLKKSGKSDEDILATLKRIHFSRQRTIAVEVLSPPEPPEEKKEENKPGSDFTSPATGGSSEPSSSEQPDVT